MKILFHKNFLKNYHKRIAFNQKLDSHFKERFAIFQSNSKNSLLKDHRLTGKKKEYRAFSITGDIRVVYKIYGDTILFYDIGTHNQVY